MKKDVRGDLSAMVVPSLTERAAEIRLANAQHSKCPKLASDQQRADADNVQPSADSVQSAGPAELGLDDDYSSLDGWSTDYSSGDRQGSETPPTPSTRAVSPTYDDMPVSPKKPTVSPFFNVLLNNSLTMEFFVF
jgi:hypothetical protein